MICEEIGRDNIIGDCCLEDESLSILHQTCCVRRLSGDDTRKTVGAGHLIWVSSFSCLAVMNFDFDRLPWPLRFVS